MLYYGAASVQTLLMLPDKMMFDLRLDQNALCLVISKKIYCVNIDLFVKGTLKF